MPVKKSTTPSAEIIRKTPAQLRKENEELREEIDKIKDGCYCHMCGKFSRSEQFYISTDPLIFSGRTFICKKCAYEIACPKNDDGDRSEPTKATVMKALEYLDKPFLGSLWDSSYYEWQNSKKSNIWTTYIKNVTSLNQYKALRWKDGDLLRGNKNIGKLDAALPSDLEEKEFDLEKSIQDELFENYESNKRSVIKMLGYDPFSDYPNDADKPFLYGNLDLMIDEGTKDSGIKMIAAVQVVRLLNQARKLGVFIDNLINDPTALEKNGATGNLKGYSDTQKKLYDSANHLAKDNGISVNHNHEKSKGMHTLSAKIKKLSEPKLGFRDVQINTFDYGTCEGMRQVAELSEAARHKQIGYDENIAQEIKDIKVDLVEQLSKERDGALETVRILLTENLDLKKYFKSKGLLDEDDKVII